MLENTLNKKDISKSMVKKINNNGFTLIELLISIAIFSVIVGFAGTAYVNNLKSSISQQEFSQLNNNLGATFDIMTRDIKLAGLDPSEKAGAKIITADYNQISFTMDCIGGLNDGEDNDDDGFIDEGTDTIDNNGNGYTDEPDEAESYDADIDDDGEDITYSLDNVTNQIIRSDNNKNEQQIVAGNIDALQFIFIDKDGLALNTPNTSVVSADMSKIQSVLVSIVGRTNDTRYVYSTSASSQEYKNQKGGLVLSAQNDDKRRAMLSTEIVFRNINLAK